MDRERPGGSRVLAVAFVVASALLGAGCSSGETSTSASSTGAASGATSTTTAAPVPASPSSVVAPEGATVLQPAQPTSGPGGSALEHDDWRVSEGGAGADAWFVFEPVGPQPATAPVSVVMHGYYEFDGYDSEYELIRHTVRTGRIVIYPRWQTEVATPCPGPLDIEPCIASAVNGVEGALAFLHADPSRVQPDLDDTTWFGHSFGGVITANLANRWKALGLPEPKALFLDDPHDGGLTGTDEPAFDDSMAGIPTSTRVECHVGAEGVIAEAGMADASCNALWPMLDHIPAQNKALVLTHPDAHGQPPLSSRHGVCTAFPGRADAYDWNFCWKVWDALQPGTGQDVSAFALTDSHEHRELGTWSDGVPITPLKIQAAGPIRP